MNITSRRLVAIITFLCGIAFPTLAQSPEMADQMRSEGKIYVLLAIVLTVLIGLVIYLFLLDRRISRLEKTAGKS